MGTHILGVGKTTPPLSRYHNHSHNVWEIVLYTHGKGIALVGEDVFEFFPGRIIIIPPHIPHSEVGDGLYEDYSIRVSDFFWPHGIKPCALLDRDNKLPMLADCLFTEFYGGCCNSVPLCDAFMNVVYQYLIRFANESDKPSVVDAAKTAIIRNLTNADYDITKTIASSGYCDDYFRRLFKKETGFTPQGYLEDLRIHYASQILANDYSTKICEVARSSGFTDPYYFSRTFRKKTGMSPREYLNLIRATDSMRVMENQCVTKPVS